MTKYVYHTGTGTYFALDDEVLIIDTDKVWAHADGTTAQSLIDDDLIEMAFDKFGAKYDLYEWLTTNDMTNGNTISYSPSSIRDEVQEMLSFDDYADEYKDALMWAVGADAETLNSVAQYILNDDDLWSSYRRNLIEGISAKFDEYIERRTIEQEDIDRASDHY